MPPKLDETYVPRPWRCGECRRVLGVVMRDTNRIRRLWVFSADRDENALPPTADLRRAPRGMFKVHAADSCDGVECSKCGALTEWSRPEGIKEIEVCCTKCKREFEGFRFLDMEGVRRLVNSSAVIYHVKMACVHCGTLFQYHEDDKRLERDALIILEALHSKQ